MPPEKKKKVATINSPHKATFHLAMCYWPFDMALSKDQGEVPLWKFQQDEKKSNRISLCSHSLFWKEIKSGQTLSAFAWSLVKTS